MVLSGQAHSLFPVPGLGYDQKILFPLQQLPGPLSHQVVVVS